MSPAWLYYTGTKAGLSRAEIMHLPIGQTLDRIACWRIAEQGAKEKRRPADIFDF